MKKFFFCLAAVCLTVCNANAGGLVTNSNQSASFLRNPARDAVIDIDGVYTNPAGVNFMSQGFHFGFTIQHPEQQRNVTTTFPTLALNANHLGETTRLYKGQASAPVVPSFQAAYVMKNWTFSASFAFNGGGGKCEFDDGIGSIESALSLLPLSAAKQMGYDIGTYTYSMNSYMKGRQYYYGIQLGAGYKINDHVAVFAGLRAVIGDATYTGYVRDIQFTSYDNSVTAPYTEGVINAVNQQVSDIEMTTDQSCVGWTPIIGVDWKINEHWNLAAKYEFRTKMSLKNSTKEMSLLARTQSALDKFNDQTTPYVRDDIPGTFTLGVQYSPINSLRFSGGFHYYDDCNAKKYNDEQDLIEHGTREFLLGAEWDVTKLVTASIGWQNTHYSLSDEYMQDMSYNCSSNLLGLGVRLNVSKKVSVDVGYMHNFYQDKTVVDPNYTVNGIQTGLTKTDTYERSNDVWAVGVNLNL